MPHSVFTWPIGYQSLSSIPTAFVAQYEADIKAWALSSKPKDEIANIGGVDLIKRIWDGVVHVAPLRPIDEWALEGWPHDIPTQTPAAEQQPAETPPAAGNSP